MDWSKPFTSLIELIREVVPDGDARAALELQVLQLQAQVQMAVLASDLPWWVRSLHLMGRQMLLVVGVLVVIALSVWQGRPIDWEQAAAILGAPQLYILLKGKGQ